MLVLPSYGEQSRANQLTGFYMRATLVFNGLTCIIHAWYEVFNFFGRHSLVGSVNPACIYLLKVNNGNTRTICEICSKLTIKGFRMISVTSFLYLYCLLSVKLPEFFWADRCIHQIHDGTTIIVVKRVNVLNLCLQMLLKCTPWPCLLVYYL